MNILANDGISASGKSKLELQGWKVYTKTIAQEDLATYINAENIECLLVRSATKVRKELIDQCPDLQIIGRGGVGMDNIDVDYARSIGRHVINTPAASSASVAELVFAHLLGMIRSLPHSNRNMPLEGNTNFKTLKKKYSKGAELAEKTLGIIGMGRIAKEIAKRALLWNMKVVFCTRSMKSEKLSLEILGNTYDLLINPISKEEVLRQSDFLTINIPAQKEFVIDYKELGMMKEGAYLVNVARGGVVNEEAVIEALEEEHLAGAAFDVFINEPYPSMELLVHPQISLTPHIGGQTIEAQDRIGTELADQIISIHNSQLQAVN